MQYPSWQSSRQHTVDHTPRRPWDTSLYRLVYHYRDEFEYRWSELFEQQYGFLRAEVLDALDRFLNCGILRHGCARARCEKCNHSVLIAFSCKRRGVCPSCQAKRAVLFAEHLHENVLLQHPHRHVIFSLPKRLRIYFRFDRALFKLLYRAAWETLSEYIRWHFPTAIPGAVMALHTAGDLLHWHPHIHAVVLNGSIDDCGKFLELPSFDSELLEERFSELVFNSLLEQSLISQDLIDSMNSWQHSGFNLYTAEPIAPDDENARLFLARYLKKAPLSAARLSVDTSGLDPTVCYSKPTDDGQMQTREFSPLEFLAELSLHIPDTWEQTTRMYGCYSSSARGKDNRERRHQALIQSNFQPLEREPEKPPTSASFSKCMKLVFEINPLRCPRCGENMKIVAFILDSREIEKIATNLGRITWRAPPPFTPAGIHLETSHPFSQTKQ